MTQMLATTETLPALLCGTVIDHVPAGQGLTIVNILYLTRDQVSIALNLPSATYGKKDLIKVRDRKLTPQETDRLALLAPQATIIIVHNGEITDKRKVQLPDEVRGIYQCPNPRCITSHEPVETRFAVLRRAKAVSLQCHYCEALYDQN